MTSGARLQRWTNGGLTIDSKGKGKGESNKKYFFIIFSSKL